MLSFRIGAYDCSSQEDLEKFWGDLSQSRFGLQMQIPWTPENTDAETQTDRQKGMPDIFKELDRMARENFGNITLTDGEQKEG